jgi:uncharacterized protein YndB with AHSA1/START domain
MTAEMNRITVSRVIAASAEMLFQAWTDPRKLAHWWRQAGDGWAFAGAAVDLRVGGAYRLAMTDPAGKRHVAFGQYVEIDRPVRLVFTWAWDDPTVRLGSTTVTVEFRDRGSRGTEVVVTHDGFGGSTHVGRHQQGWTELLQLLERSLA